jgi:hypothetical protein
VNPKLKEAFDQANYLATLANQRQIFLEEYQQELVYFHNGGTFKATQQLITFVKLLIDLGHAEETLVDDNNTPIRILNLDIFLTELLSKYQYATSGFYTKYDQIKKSRTTQGLTAL